MLRAELSSTKASSFTIATLLTWTEASYYTFNFLLSNLPLPSLLFEVFKTLLVGVAGAFCPIISCFIHPTPQRNPHGELTLTHPQNTIHQVVQDKSHNAHPDRDTLTPLAAQSTPEPSSSHDNYGSEPQNAVATDKAASVSLVFLSPPSYLTPWAPIYQKHRVGMGVTTKGQLSE